MSEESAKNPGAVLAADASCAGDLGRPELQAVQFFFVALTKAVQSLPLYQRNNQAMQRFFAHSAQLLAQCQGLVGELDLRVRRDRFVLHGVDVFIDPDRDSGLPFRLFRDGLRRLTFGELMAAEELTQLIEILAQSREQMGLDGDLVSALWRAELPNFSYVTIDVFDATTISAGDEAFQETETLRQDLDQLLAAIYRNQSGEDAEILRSVNIGGDDLLALASLGEDSEAERERIGHASAREIFALGEGVAERLRTEIENEDDAKLRDTTFDVLIGALLGGRSAAESAKVIQELLALYDGMLLAQDLCGVTSLMRQLASHAEANDLKTKAIVTQLSRAFAAPQRLAILATHLNDGIWTSPLQFKELLILIGPGVVDGILDLLSAVQQPQHRRSLCEILLEIDTPALDKLSARFGQGDWFVDRDLLHLAAHLDPQQRLPLLVTACAHPHALVRQAAVGLLAHAQGDVVTQTLIASLRDPESPVRVGGVRSLVSQGEVQSVPVLAEILQDPQFKSRSSSELRTFTQAYARLAGPQAVPVLAEILLATEASKKGGFLEKLRSTVEALAEDETALRTAAAAALGGITSEAAQNALRAGGKNKNKAVREACERALVAQQRVASGQTQEQGEADE